MAAVALVAALLAAWEAVARLGAVDPLLLPAPTSVARALWEDRALLAGDLGVTALEVGLGLTLAVAAGIAVALLMHESRAARRALAPLVIGSQAVPVPVVAPLLVLALGFGIGPKLAIVALICFFPVAINGLDGLRSADPEQRELLRSLQATRWQTLRFLEAPAALPALFTGLKVAAAVSVIGAVFAEWAGSSAGLGHALLLANGQLETARAFAIVVVLTVLAVALYGLLALLERRLVPWAARTRPGGS